MRRGDAGESVRELQDALSFLGYAIDVDGVFGPATDATVRDFQRDHGLVVDGIVGPITRAAIAAASPRQHKTEHAPWMAIALQELGVSEIPGTDHNARIIEYHQATSLRATDDETPWCSSFVNWCMGRAGYPRTDSAAARSWLQWGKRIDTPVYGCVVIFSRPPSPSSGHVAFYLGQRSGRIEVLGGNQGNKVSVATYPANRLLGYRMPR